MTITQNDIKLDETGDKKISDVILEGVKNFNAPYFGNAEWQSFTLYIKDKDYIIAGIVGSSKGDLIRVDSMWVSENYRRQRIGEKLLHRLDIFARSKNCEIILLDTFDFQARTFYEKHGYECIGTIYRLYKNFDSHFMRRIL